MTRPLPPGVVRRKGEPSKAYKASLKPLTEDAYVALATACVEAILAGEEWLLIKQSYLVKARNGFPAGRLVSREGKDNVKRYRAKKVLEWLAEKGYTPITPAAIRASLAYITHVERKILDVE